MICPKCDRETTNLEIHDKLKHTCLICDFRTYNATTFTNHLRWQHKTNVKEYADKYVYKEVPKCGCGCAKVSKFDTFNGYKKYLLNHNKKPLVDKLKEDAKKYDKDLLVCLYCNKKVKDLELHNKQRHHCQICGTFAESSKAFTWHLKNEHSIDLEQYSKEYVYKFEEPGCKCGCGQKTLWNKEGYSDYIRYHQNSDSVVRDKTTKSRYINNKGAYSDIEKLKATNLERFGVDWQITTTQTREKISNTLQERYNSTNAFNIPVNDPGSRLLYKAQQTRLNRFGTQNMNIFKKRSKHSKAELVLSSSTKDKFSQPLIIQYKEFDSYHKRSNSLIELDGIYYHPQSLENIQFSQLTHYFNDKQKDEIAKKLGYNLIRIRSEIIVENMTYDELKELQYIKNYDYTLDTIIMSVEYLSSMKNKYFDVEGLKQSLTRFLNILIKKAVPDGFIDSLFDTPHDLTIKSINEFHTLKLN